MPVAHPHADSKAASESPFHWVRAAAPTAKVRALQPTLQRKVGARGTQKSPTKERITIRLSRDVVERFRATGDGWQTCWGGMLFVLRPTSVPLEHASVRP
ncbi:MAG TPA: BrnA antitoxin family protein [Rubrivivax sp.]|nr:BrnA antitoxin family protein [Rubrivivax sp.]